jgi:hypothetical protein
MKRKEPLNKIKSLLINLEGVCTPSLKADLILTELEKLGMLPPHTKVLKKRIVEISGEFVPMELIENVNEWEN